jgi:hypothetical protein
MMSSKSPLTFFSQGPGCQGFSLFSCTSKWGHRPAEISPFSQEISLTRALNLVAKGDRHVQMFLPHPVQNLLQGCFATEAFWDPKERLFLQSLEGHVGDVGHLCLPQDASVQDDADAVLYITYSWEPGSLLSRPGHCGFSWIFVPQEWPCYQKWVLYFAERVISKLPQKL